MELNSFSVLFRMNSTTTDWMRTSMKAAVPLKQADSICLDLGDARTRRHALQYRLTQFTGPQRHGDLP